MHIKMWYLFFLNNSHVKCKNCKLIVSLVTIFGKKKENDILKKINDFVLRLRLYQINFLLGCLKSLEQ